MILAPLDFEKFPPLYNPIYVPGAMSVEAQPTPKNVSALEASNPSNLKAALDQSSPQFAQTNHKALLNSEQKSQPPVASHLLAVAGLSADYVSLIKEAQSTRILANVVIAAYEAADQSRKTATLRIVA